MQAKKNRKNNKKYRFKTKKTQIYAIQDCQTEWAENK